MKNIADYIIAILAKNGVKNIYGYPGATIIPLMDAVKRHPDTSWILVRNEHAAALAASAEAKLTGRLAVCMGTSGPGTTGLLTGMLDAHYDWASVMAITGIAPTWKFGREEFQDIDPLPFFGHYIGRSVHCTHPDQIPSLLRDCIGCALQELKVVHLAIPPDLQLYSFPDEDERFSIPNPICPFRLFIPSMKAFDIMIPEIIEEKEILIVVGPRAKGCGEAIEELATKLNAPIITSIDGKGIINEMHPCSIGVLGIFGSPGIKISHKILSSASAIMAFGINDLAPFLVGKHGLQVRKLYQFEPDFASLSYRYHPHRTIIGPLDKIIKEIINRIPSVNKCNVLLQKVDDLKREFTSSISLNQFQEGSYVHQATFLMHLNKYLDNNTIICLDIGDNTLWSAQFLILTHHEKILTSNKMGVMGFCLPACIAARLTNKEAKIIGICGDGGFQMVIGELATAVQYQLPFVFIVFNNGVLQRVIAQQKHAYGTYIYNPDFVQLARAYGADGAVIDCIEDIDKVLDQAFAHKNTPFIIDLKCSPEIQAPYL